MDLFSRDQREFYAEKCVEKFPMNGSQAVYRLLTRDGDINAGDPSDE
jgi:hypothetical protein